jgi:hypothetical protein
MKKLKFYLLLFSIFIPISHIKAQSYGKKLEYDTLGTWSNKVNLVIVNKISISSYITKQKILTHANYDVTRKTVGNLPKYRYELILISKSKKNNILVNTWIYNAKVFINNIEVTRDQFPNGFTALINVKPTTIYRYETSSDTINIKVTWESSNYFKNK